MKYILFNDGITKGLLTNNGSTFIPFDPANTDFQEYLKWLADGNTPLPADEVGA